MRRTTFLLLAFSLASQGLFTASAAGQESSCELLDTAEVVYLVPAAANAQVRSREKPYPSCTYTWPAAKPIQKSIGGRVMEMPGEGRLTLTLAAVKDAETDWSRVIASYGNQELLDVPAVGTSAVWSAQRHQLSVLAGSHIIHVALENPDEPGVEYESAVRLALLLADMYE